MVYASAFADAKLVYTPTFEGFKEDIVVNKYNGVTEYSFRLLTNGAVLKDGKLYYEGEETARLGDITVFDSGGQVDLGEIKAETVKEGSEYLVAVCVSDAFMKDAVYPVYIDPSITINTSGSGSNKTIQDAPVYSNNNNANGGNEYNLCGYCGSSLGYGRVLYYLPGLTERTDYQSITASQINSVTLSLREASGKTGTATVKSYPFKESWGETVVTKNNVNVSNYETSSTYSSAQTFSSSPNWWTFDLTQTVKAWKNGSFGSGAYGVILKNNNETDSAYYRNFLATEYSNASYRPYITFTYTPKITISASIDTIVEGSNLYLTATTSPTGLTVTWSSSNPTIATVSGGTVTGIKAGNVTITASCIVAGVTYSTACSVYVRIANGVYYIKNNYSNLYAHAQNGGISSFTNIYQYMKNSTTGTSHLRQIWKIYYIGDGYYSIRPMHKLNMGLDVTGTNVDIFNIGTTDTVAGVASYARWTISYITSGYVLQRGGSSTYTLSLESDSTSSGTNICAQSYSGYTRQKWTFEPLGFSPAGVLLYNTETQGIVTNPTKYIAPGSTLTLSQLKLSAAVYSTSTISQTFTWSTSNSSIATVNSSNGTVTGVSPGTVTITGLKYLSGNPYNVQFTLTVTEVANGTYFIRNKATNRLIDIDGPSMNAGAIIHQWDFHGYNQEKWILELQSDGYYTIQSVYSSLYVGIENASSSSGAAVKQYAYSSSDNSLRWKVTKLSNGAFKLTPKSGVAYDRALSIHSSGNANGTDLVQYTYTNDGNYKDEWVIISKIYGTQKFRILESDEWTNINCHGYAMMRDDIPINWCPNGNAYLSSVPFNPIYGLNDYSTAIQTGISEAIKEDFENWLNNNGYNNKWEYEINFTGNGSDRVLNDNQYRVVLRTGLHNIYYYDEYNNLWLVKMYDYHFWYQTYDGTWANKHGQLEPEPLGSGITPFSANTSGWSAVYENFYNGIIYSYIITRN